VATVTVTGGTLWVGVNDVADGYVYADAVRVVPAGAAPAGAGRGESLPSVFSRLAVPGFEIDDRPELGSSITKTGNPVGGDGTDTLLGGRGRGSLPGGADEQTAAVALGYGGLPALDATAVYDAGAADSLTDGTGLDWYWATPGLDVLRGRSSSERLN